MDIAEEMEKPSKRKKFLLIGGSIGILLLIGAGIWWWMGKSHAVTDNATVAGHIVPVSAKVSGTVSEVNFKEGQYVKKGQVLVRLDPTDYRITVQQAEANLKITKNQATSAEAQVGLSQGTTSNRVQESVADVSQAQSSVSVARQQLATARARVDAARAQFTEAEQHLGRMRNLRRKEFVSQADLDRAQAAYDTTKAQLDVANQQVFEAQASVSSAQAGLRQSQAGLGVTRAQTKEVNVQQSQAKAQQSRIEQAEAQLAEARQRLSYTTIVAPISGTVGRKNVELGQVVQPNQPLFSVVPLEDIWIEANYKETELRGIHPGAKAEIEVDAYPNQKFQGVVEAIGAATGSQFSLLPPENASGNFVKVVQWLPVRIRLNGKNPQKMLRPGMSVVVDIHRQD